MDHTRVNVSISSTTVISSGVSPSSSATICETTVWWPWPCGVVPRRRPAGHGAGWDQVAPPQLNGIHADPDREPTDHVPGLEEEVAARVAADQSRHALVHQHRRSIDLDNLQPVRTVKIARRQKT